MTTRQTADYFPMPERPTPPDSVADLLERLGGVPAWRVRMVPPPGMATEADVVEIEARTDVICELVDHTLVVRPPNCRNSFLMMHVICRVMGYLDENDLGIAVGATAPIRIPNGNVRSASLLYIPWDNMPGRRIPSEPITSVPPALAIDMLTADNTAAEMARKRADYFATGVKLVWQIDPDARTAQAFAGPDVAVVLDDAGTLDGGTVLPGFALSLADLFAKLDIKAPSAS
ncbi:MAG: Uma2 family endonuclease [Gemmataceae bacterium]